MGVFSPNLPGCVAIGDTPEEALAGFREASVMHLDDLREQGLSVPGEYAGAEEEIAADGVYFPWASVDATVKV